MCGMFLVGAEGGGRLPGHSPGAFFCRWKSGGSAPPVRQGYSVTFVPKMYRTRSSRYFLFDSRTFIPFIIFRQHLPLWA